MAIGDFQNKNICFSNYGNIDAETTTLSTPGEYQPLGIRTAQEMIENNVKMVNGRFQIIDTGVYFCQYRFAFSGGVNNTYKFRLATLKNFVTTAVPDSEIEFNTKSTNTWEVCNTMFIKFDPVDIDDKGFGTTKQELFAQVQNVNNANDLVSENYSIVIAKII